MADSATLELRIWTDGKRTLPGMRDLPELFAPHTEYVAGMLAKDFQSGEIVDERFRGWWDINPTTTVYVLEGQHFSTPGRPMTVHRSKASADKEAASLVNIMLKDAGLKQTATAKNWPDKLASVNRRLAREAGVPVDTLQEHERCDVFLTELKLEG